MNQSTVMEPEVLAPKIDEQKKTDLEARAQKFLEIAKGLTVKSNDDYKKADEFCDHALKHKNNIVAFFKPIKQAQDKAKKVILDQEKAAVVPIDQGRSLLKEKMLGYEREEMKKKKEAEAKAAEEFRKQQEEQRKAEAKKREAEAEALAAQGRDVEAVELLDAPLPVNSVPAVAPVIPSTVPKSKTIIPQNWDFEITNEALIPREFMIPDDKSIRALVKAQKSKTRIPGIRAFDRNAR
jgi:hypothetical protein